jgi:hypothetical protein
MVQEAIRMVLESIYEPVFQHMNCSFGFRARNGVHHAITMLKDPRNTSGLTHIIEGDSCFPAVLAPAKQPLFKISFRYFKGLLRRAQ